MTIHDLTTRRSPFQPSAPFSPTAQGLAIAFGLIQTHQLPDCHVHVFNQGRNVVLDYTGSRHAAGDVRVACQALGLVVEELASETPDGAAAIELRGSDYLNGVLRTVRAVVPLEPKWPVL